MNDEARALADRDELLELLAETARDPLAHILAMFPWGVPGTELEHRTGPEPWQTDVLTAIRDGLVTPYEAIRIARASGHGIGKSALVAWIILWAIGTFPGARGVVTANTENQLRTRTWVELGKWYRLWLARDLFNMERTTIRSIDPEWENSWRIDMVPWSESNPEAFAGYHNKGRRLIIIFDEASTIADNIWETISGALTDSGTELVWAVFGNPTKNTGRFRDCFGREVRRWNAKCIDARTVSIGNRDYYNQLIEDWGIDSNYVKVRVLGQFPAAGDGQFISSDIVMAAQSREIGDGDGMTRPQPDAPMVMGVDVARFGKDRSVIWFRRGRDAKSVAPRIFQGLDTMKLADQVAIAAMEHRTDAIFVDGGGVGGGVIDRLRQMNVGNVMEVQFGAKPDELGLEGDHTTCLNKRAEIWSTMRMWLKGGAIPADKDIRLAGDHPFSAELISMEFGFNGGRLKLASKEDIRRDGRPSPESCGRLGADVRLSGDV